MTRTHDYKHYVTTSLFAALDIATGEVSGRLKRRHRSSEFLAFLKEVDANAPQDLAVHLVMDNYATHKTDKVKEWLAAPPLRSAFHANICFMAELGRALSLHAEREVD